MKIDFAVHHQGQAKITSVDKLEKKLHNINIKLKLLVFLSPKLQKSYKHKSSAFLQLTTFHLVILVPYYNTPLFTPLGKS